MCVSERGLCASGQGGERHSRGHGVCSATWLLGSSVLHTQVSSCFAFPSEGLFQRAVRIVPLPNAFLSSARLGSFFFFFFGGRRSREVSKKKLPHEMTVSCENVGQSRIVSDAGHEKKKTLNLLFCRPLLGLTFSHLCEK